MSFISSVFSGLPKLKLKLNQCGAGAWTELGKRLKNQGVIIGHERSSGGHYGHLKMLLFVLLTKIKYKLCMIGRHANNGGY